MSRVSLAGCMAVSIVLAFAACSSDDSPSSSTPQSKCNALYHKLCGRATTQHCMTGTEADCFNQYTTSCNNATAVSASYNQCMGDLDGWTCSSTSTPLPSSCQGVIVVGSGGSGGSGGSSVGGGGTGGSGGSCVSTGNTCSKNGDCCNFQKSSGYCVDFGSGARCADACTSNTGCTSGCCALLQSGNKACGPSTACK